MRANLNKSIQNQLPRLNKVPAGLHPLDKNVELWGDISTRIMYWSKNGKTEPIESLPKMYKDILYTEFFKNISIIQRLFKKFKCDKKAFNEWLFCKYGSMDSQPDFNGLNLHKTENFLCKSQLVNPCPCLAWKKIIVHKTGAILTLKEIQVLELLGKELTIDEIAEYLFVSPNTVKTHKANLFKKFKVHEVKDLVMHAISDNIIKSHY